VEIYPSTGKAEEGRKREETVEEGPKRYPAGRPREY
jgi:hypothetical protein